MGSFQDVPGTKPSKGTFLGWLEYDLEVKKFIFIWMLCVLFCVRFVLFSLNIFWNLANSRWQIVGMSWDALGRKPKGYPHDFVKGPF